MVRHPEHAWCAFMIPRAPIAPRAKIVTWKTMEDVATRFIAAVAPADVRSLMVLRTVEADSHQGTLRLHFDAARTVKDVHIWLAYDIGLEIGMDNGLISAATVSDGARIPQALRHCPNPRVITKAIAAGTAALQFSPMEVAPLKNVVWDMKTACWHLSVIPSRSWLRKGLPLRTASVRVDGDRVLGVQLWSPPKDAEALAPGLYRRWLVRAASPDEPPSAEAIRLLRSAGSSILRWWYSLRPSRDCGL
ncbi:MAG: hypothetical protein WCP21_15325 [Armatimonadota bacterium]